MPRYRVTKDTPIRRHLMPATSKNAPVTNGMLLKDDEFPGAPFGDWVQIQEAHRSGFVSKTAVKEIKDVNAVTDA